MIFFNKERINKKRGQVWIETVVYTLIGIVIIGMVLAFGTPIIREYQDKQAFNAALNSFNELDFQITQVHKFGPGNSRELVMYMSHGNLIIHADNNQVVTSSSSPCPDPLNMEDFLELKIEGLDYQPGEVGGPYRFPGTNFHMEVFFNGNNYDVILSRNFSEDKIDLKYNLADTSYTFSPSPGPYRIVVSNMGRNSSDCRANVPTGINLGLSA